MAGLAGVGEASAIVGLIATAAALSKSIIDISSKYKGAEKQLAAFGRELNFLSRILDQLRQFLEQQSRSMDTEASLLTMQIVDETTTLFSELDFYRESLYRGHSSGADQGVSLRGKTKWAFQTAELQAQRDRVNSMKINILLMMMMMLSNRVPPPYVSIIYWSIRVKG